jgi:DNA replication protein DnaC
MKRLAKTHLIVIDDLGLAPLTDPERRDLLEVMIRLDPGHQSAPD